MIKQRHIFKLVEKGFPLNPSAISHKNTQSIKTYSSISIIPFFFLFLYNPFSECASSLSKQKSFLFHTKHLLGFQSTRQYRKHAGVAISPSCVLPLTEENVEKVLDQVRPGLMADGGNVALHENDGLVVVLKLQGGCGSCPSSTMTPRMGIETKLRDKIPEIL